MNRLLGILIIAFLFGASISYAQDAPINANSGKLNSLFNPLNLGNNIKIIDKNYGEPYRDDGIYRDYLIDNCHVTIVAPKGYIATMALELSDKCSVNPHELYRNRISLNSNKNANDLTFGDFKDAFFGRDSAYGGNCCQPAAFVFDVGAHVNDYIDLLFIRKIDDGDDAYIAMQSLIDKTKKQYPKLAKDELFKVKTCHRESSAMAIEMFKNIKFDYLIVSKDNFRDGIPIAKDINNDDNPPLVYPLKDMAIVANNAC